MIDLFDWGFAALFITVLGIFFYLGKLVFDLIERKTNRRMIKNGKN